MGLLVAVVLGAFSRRGQTLRTLLWLPVSRCGNLCALGRGGFPRATRICSSESSDWKSPSVGPAAGRHSGVLVRCLVSWTTLVVQVGRYVVDPALNSDPEHFQLVFCVLAGQVWGRSIQKEIHGNMAKQD